MMCLKVVCVLPSVVSLHYVDNAYIYYKYIVFVLRLTW